MEKIISQWYFDFGEGMSEGESRTEEYALDPTGMTKQVIVIPKGCKHFRWDPCNFPCLLFNTEFRKGDSEYLTPKPQNGYINGDTAFFYNEDPQLLFDFDGETVVDFELTICANVHIVDDRFLMDASAKVLARNDMLADEIKKITASQTLKNRLRKAKNLLLGKSSQHGDNIYESDEDVQSGLMSQDLASNRAVRRILRNLMTPPKEYGLFVPYKDHDIKFSKDDVKPIAYYLPQFHAIPENDEWWGKGFTEWANVVKSLPRYEGHYQPHLPYDVGFYDLSNIDIMMRQIELAKNYGIFGFCFYYYWFGGKRLLEKPIENYLQNPDKLDFPFCLCWANENWTRQWDGESSQILIEQNHSDEDDLGIIEDLSRYFADQRYIRIDGKPLIIIYRGNLLPDIKNTVKLWKEYCAKNGIGEIVVAGNSTFDISNPKSLGFDIGIEFPPHGMKNLPSDVKESALPQPMAEYNYYYMDSYIENIESNVAENKDLLKGVFVNWDNSARRQNMPNMLIISPEQYKVWLSKCVEITKRIQKPEQRFVFINAWNEWAEGAHLEPDQRYGYAYLEATAEALERE